MCVWGGVSPLMAFFSVPRQQPELGEGVTGTLDVGQSFGQLWITARSDCPEGLLPSCPLLPVCCLLPRRARRLLPGRHPPPLRRHEGSVSHHLPCGPTTTEPHVRQGEPRGESLARLSSCISACLDRGWSPRKAFYTSSPRSWKLPLLLYSLTLTPPSPVFFLFSKTPVGRFWEEGFFPNNVPGPW